MNYLHVAFLVLAPLAAAVLLILSLIGVFEFYIEYRNKYRDRRELIVAEAFCAIAMFVAATAFYYSVPVFVKELL